MIPKAMIFDVFGTLVDWRSAIAVQVQRQLPSVDALAFADAWRGEYQPAMERIRAGNRGYVPLDDLHLENLMIVAERFGAKVADPGQLARAWERLTPWPDTVAGLTRLKKLGIIAPCSNGSIAMMTRLARHAALPWDCIVGADIAQDYKPKFQVYLASCAALRLAPAEVMMVACHASDLEAAAALGLQTGFVPRPDEYGPGGETDQASDNWTINGADLLDLAAKLGV